MKARGRRGGKDRGYHFRIAAGSTAELAAAVRFAMAWDFCAPQPELFALIDRELAMLWKLERAQPLRAEAVRQGRRLRAAAGGRPA